MPFIEQIQQQIIHATNNQIFTGGLMLTTFAGMAAGLVATLRSYPGRIYNYLKSKAIMSVEIRSNDEAFHWLMVWLNNLPYAQKNRRVTLKTWMTAKGPKFLFTPAPGMHFFRHKGRFYWLGRDQKTPGGNSPGFGNFTPLEELTLKTIFGTREHLVQILQEARDVAKASEDEGVTIRVSRNGHWNHCGVKPYRPMESLVLDGDMTQDLIQDAERFLESKAWYAKMGIPWRRGYLLYGPPGNGKSTLSLALASYLKSDIHMVNLAELGVSDSQLAYLFNDTTPNSIIVLEEIDTLFASREPRPVMRRRGEEEDAPVDLGGPTVAQNQLTYAGGEVTLGGLLNAIDGITAPEGRILIMTTNYPERLDPALIRPGRADRKFELTNATHDQIRRMCERFFPEKGEMFVLATLAQIPDKVISMAALQEHCMVYREDPDEFIRTLPELVVKAQPFPAKEQANVC